MSRRKRTARCLCGGEVVTNLPVALGLGGKSHGDQGSKTTIPLCASCLLLEQQQQASRYGSGRWRASGYFNQGRKV